VRIAKAYGTVTEPRDRRLQHLDRGFGLELGVRVGRYPGPAGIAAEEVVGETDRQGAHLWVRIPSARTGGDD